MAPSSLLRWSVELGPDSALPEDFWRGLFARTYAAELRVGNPVARRISLASATERYRLFLPLALGAADVRFYS